MTLPFEDTGSLRPDAYVPEITPVSDHFTVTNPQSADWVVQRIIEVRQEQADVDAAYSRTLDQWKAWRNGERERLARQEEWWTGLLQAYWFRYAQDHPKAKSLKLPHGRLQQRKQPRRITVEQPAQFTAWAVEHYPTLIRTKYEPDMMALKKLIEENWTVPGVDVTDVPDRFSVATEGAAADGD